METELFGDRAATQEQLLDYLEETVQNDFRLNRNTKKCAENISSLRITNTADISARKSKKDSIKIANAVTGT